jgi:hypothetical protein
MARQRRQTSGSRMLDLPTADSTGVALLQSANGFSCREPRVAPVGNGLTLGCGVQPRCGWRPANTGEAIQRLGDFGSNCYDPTMCWGPPSHKWWTGPAKRNVETRTKR